ncbi:putative ribonuclease H-like domain-containing protein, partial [Tanacetum coccineum]
MRATKQSREPAGKADNIVVCVRRGVTSGIRACALRNFDLEEVIENGNSWVPIPVTTPLETGTSTATKMIVPSTIEEKTCKKNDVKARSLLLMALPNEHQLTFDQYVNAQSMFAAIKARFGRNEETKKTQKALLKQQYENFSASSSESLDYIFNRLQRLVSRLSILGVVTPPEGLNVKILRSLPSEWDTHVVVWMDKPDFDTMGFDDLYNNFKIVEQKVKKSAGARNNDKNLAFVTTSGASSTNNINIVNPEVSTATTKVNTASTEICTASFSDATIYAFLSTKLKGYQLVHEDLAQLHDDDLEEMDLKWNMALLSMRARKFYQRIEGKSSLTEATLLDMNNQRNWNQGSSTKAVKIEDASEKAMCAIDGAGFDWSDMAEEEIQANMALMAFSDSEVTNDKSCSKNCLKNYEALKKQYDDLLVKLSDTDFKAATYKRGLATLEGQIVKYREHEVLFSEEIALLKRSVGSKEYQMGLLRAELEKVKQEKEGFEFKIAKFDKSAKDLEQLLGSQITDKSKKGFGYNDVPSPHPLILNRLTTLDLSYSGLEEFKESEVNEYGPRDSSLKPTIDCDKESDNSKENTDDSLEQHQITDTETSSVKSLLKVDKDWKEKFFYPANHVREVEPKKVRENNDAPIIEDWVSNDEDDDELNPKVEKKTVISTATKKEFVKPVKRSIRHAYLWEVFDHIQLQLVLNPPHQRKRIISKTIDGGYVTFEEEEHMHLQNFCKEPKTVSKALSDPTWVEAMQEELLQFKLQKIEEEVYVCQPPGFEDLDHPNKVYKDSPLELVAYTDSDYDGATQDRKSTTRGCQFLGNRLISWQCKKQTVVATSTTELNSWLPAKLLWTVFLVQNQLLTRSAEATNDDNREVQITATIDGHSMTITEASLRRHLNPKKTAWEQFSSDIATAVIYMQRKQLQQHSRTYPVPSLSIKVFNNINRPTKGYSGQEVALFPTMLNVSEPSTSPSRLTSSPSHSPEPLIDHSPDHTTTAISFPSPTQPSPGAEQHIPTLNESPLHAVHSHGSVEGSLTLNELTTLVTKLSEKIGVLEDDLKKTKLTYSAAVTKLILRVKKLETKLKAGTARKRARVQEKASTETEPIIQEVTPTEVIQDQGSSEKGNSEVSTAGATKGTASEVPVVSTAEVNISTAGRTVTYRRRSKEKRTRKDKGKAIMTESEPKNKSKKEIKQERLSFAEAIRLQEQRAQIARDEEIARKWNEEEEQRVMSEAKSTKKIDWNDLSVIRYHALKMKPKIDWNDLSVIRETTRLVISRPMEHGSEKMKSPEKIEERDVDIQKEMTEVVKESGAKRKKSLPRKRRTFKRQKMEEDAKKEELKGY